MAANPLLASPPSVPELNLVIPVYNEEKHIASLVRDWKAMLNAIPVSHRFLFIDDGSTDNSPAILQSLSDQDPTITLHIQPNAGHGQAILAGYLLAEGSDWIFQIDSDHQLDTGAFRTLWENRDHYDLLLGEREDKHATLSRRCISFISKLIVQCLYGPGVKDVNSPYRLMRTARLREAILLIPAKSFAPNVLLTGWFVFSKARIFTVPVNRNGEGTQRLSKLNRNLAKGSLRALAETIKFRFTL